MATVEAEEEIGIPEWVVTFGDMMSLLMTFFVLLFSMSEVKQEQSVAMLESMRKQFGHDSAMVSPVPGRAPPMNSGMKSVSSMGRARRANTMNGGDKVKAPVGDHPRVWAIRPSDDATLGGAVYFSDGESELTEDDKETLRTAAGVIGGKPQKIEIRGHTSSRPLPPDSPYKNHWQLSFARCVSTMDYLTELGINPKRIRIVAAADNEPVHIGADPLIAKENSRVEVQMLDELVEDLKGTEEEKRQKYSPPPANERL